MNNATQEDEDYDSDDDETEFTSNLYSTVLLALVQLLLSLSLLADTEGDRKTRNSSIPQQRLSWETYWKSTFMCRKPFI